MLRDLPASDLADSVTTTRWRLNGDPTLEEHETDYTAVFVMQNVDTRQNIVLTLTQTRGGPASDLVGALRATAHMLESADVERSPREAVLCFQRPD